MTDTEVAGIQYLPHDTLNECGLAFAVLSDKGYFLASAEGECGMVEHLVLAIGFAKLLNNQGEIA